MLDSWKRCRSVGLEPQRPLVPYRADVTLDDHFLHAADPVLKALIAYLADVGLICEVSDGSGTSPRLRRARSTDEGGRGLFLVAQLTERWGTRYTPHGETIWTEQPWPGADALPCGGSGALR